MKVKIIKCSEIGYWYRNKIGEIFDVKKVEDNKFDYKTIKGWFILKKDCEIIMEDDMSIKKDLKEIRERLDNIEKQVEKDDFELPEYLQSYANYQKELTNQKAIILDMLLSKKRYAQIKLEYIADKLNGDWKVDYNDDDSAYCLFFDCDDNVWYVIDTSYKSAGCIYSKSEELAEKAFEIMGKEMNYLRG